MADGDTRQASRSRLPRLVRLAVEDVARTAALSLSTCLIVSGVAMVAGVACNNACIRGALPTQLTWFIDDARGFCFLDHHLHRPMWFGDVFGGIGDLCISCHVMALPKPSKQLNMCAPLPFVFHSRRQSHTCSR